MFAVVAPYLLYIGGGSGGFLGKEDRRKGTGRETGGNPPGTGAGTGAGGVDKWRGLGQGGFLFVTRILLENRGQLEVTQRGVGSLAPRPPSYLPRGGRVKERDNVSRFGLQRVAIGIMTCRDCLYDA